MFRLLGCFGGSKPPSVAETHDKSKAEEDHPDSFNKLAVKLYNTDPPPDRGLIMSVNLTYDAMDKVGTLLSEVCIEVMALRCLHGMWIFFGRPSETYKRRKLLRDISKIQGVSQVAIQTKDFDMEYPLPYENASQAIPEENCEGAHSSFKVRGWFIKPDEIWLRFQNTDIDTPHLSYKHNTVAKEDWTYYSAQSDLGSLIASKEGAWLFADRKPVSVVLFWKHPCEKPWHICIVRDF